MILDLNLAFPESLADKPRGPLPKQKLFMHLADSPGTPKYIRYCGGIGSGKTLIGCIQVLKWAIRYPGDYLIARQFMPELAVTTYKTFKEICPPELIVEDRVADKIIKIRTAVPGKHSWVMFRGLDESDKLRSLNLSGFYIDEANQVSEGAWILLQGRLRGPGLRKGIITQNSGGHDWSWRWFVKQDLFSNPEIKKEFVNIYAPSTENIHLPAGYVETILSTWSQDRIQREIHADEDSFEGQVYTEFRADRNVVIPFAIPKDWPRYVGIDHGFRNPSCWLWAAEDYDGNLYVYREFYRSEWLIEDICKNGKDGDESVMRLMKGEKIEWAKIDPSTKARRNERDGIKISDFELYQEYLPEDFPLQPANNDVTPGIDRVKTWLRPKDNGKPKLYVFSTCPNLINEFQNYRYQELNSTQQGRKNEKEMPVKYLDHAMDALRYLIMGMPEAPTKTEDVYDKLKYDSLEGVLARQLQEVRNGKPNGDPFGI